MIYLDWKSKCRKYNVIIEQNCVDYIISLAQGNNPNEIGSSLLGSYKQDGFTAIIKGVSPIPKDSVFTRFFFKRGASGLKEYYKKLYNDTEGTIHYIGEWHSHPYGEPIPSGKDDKTLFGVCNNFKINCPECISLIIGNDLIDKPKLGLYVYSRVNGRIKLLPEIGKNPFGNLI
ncbi:MAG: hypothetical protein A2X64_05720 [Ignavibacteria bacterium GWF2_33_9]|nr:MAG: hypothetical protein A2X64_05720 [Ignavibacteria bacterium GWF2_33_9]